MDYIKVRYVEDAHRVAEMLMTMSNHRIVDKDTFDLYYEDYMGKQTPKQKEKFKPLVFDALKKIDPRVTDKRVFTKAGGQQLERDQKKTAKVLVADPKEYKKRGAARVDMPPLDTGLYDLTGIVKGRVVKVRADTVQYRGKPRIVYRDRNGRFASRKVPSTKK